MHKNPTKERLQVDLMNDKLIFCSEQYKNRDWLIKDINKNLDKLWTVNA